MRGGNRRFQATTVTLVVLALGAAALFLMFERVETTVEHPPSLEARTNPYLALVYPDRAPYESDTGQGNLDQDFVRCAEIVWRPLLEALQ